MSFVAGNSGAVRPSPNSLMAGIRTQEARMPPATMTQEIFVPML